METLTGIVLDVSHSMKKNVGGEVDEDFGEWARAIFEVVDNFVKYDVSSENCIFTVGVGGNYGKGIFDVLKTIEQFPKRNATRYRQYKNNVDPESTVARYAVRTRQQRSLSLSNTAIGNPNQYDCLVEDFFYLVERNGAPQTRKWTSKEKIQTTISFEMAALLLSALQSDEDFLKEFISYCLPNACKFNESGIVPGFFASGLCKVVSVFKQATTDDILKVVERATSRLMKDIGTQYSVQRASEILHGCIDADNLTKDRIREMMKTVNPLIYGDKPMYRALKETTKIFKSSKKKKLLFVLSDGEPTDADEYDTFKELKRLDVTVVSCLVTSGAEIQPRKLYSFEKMKWNEGAKFLFRLSSSVSSQLLPRTIFLKQGWDIDISNNETKLFLQINHPDNVRDACDLARNAVCCQDSLSDLLVSISLDIYVNQSTCGFKAQMQTDGTCYANATATVLHLSMKRILGREGDYPDFKDLREKLINLHGNEGADTLNVLEGICPKYRLHCEEVDRQNAMRAIVAKRPVVARFYLTDIEWHKFTCFFKENPTGILTKATIDICKRGHGENISGHAVVLSSFDSKCLRLMNSWGDEWADQGFFRVQHSDVLGLKFIDVYWTLNDLFPKELKYYETHGSEVASQIINRLKSLQTATYKCPICEKSSRVSTFSGSVNEAVCPKCNARFKSNKAGNILALNMYLTSLAK